MTDHYKQHPSGVEAIELTRHESFLRGNILKYVLRAPYKGAELSDLRKAAEYLQWEIERVEGKSSSVQGRLRSRLVNSWKLDGNLVALIERVKNGDESAMGEIVKLVRGD